MAVLSRAVIGQLCINLPFWDQFGPPRAAALWYLPTYLS